MVPTNDENAMKIWNIGGGMKISRREDPFWVLIHLYFTIRAENYHIIVDVKVRVVRVFVFPSDQHHAPPSAREMRDIENQDGQHTPNGG